MEKTVEWKCHTSRLILEVLENNSCAILKIPINIFGKLLANVATRASQLNDPILNKLMCQLTLYEVADPYSDEYDKNVVDEVFKKAEIFQKGL